MNSAEILGGFALFVALTAVCGLLWAWWLRAVVREGDRLLEERKQLWKEHWRMIDERRST